MIWRKKNRVIVDFRDIESRFLTYSFVIQREGVDFRARERGKGDIDFRARKRVKYEINFRRNSWVIL